MSAFQLLRVGLALCSALAFWGLFLDAPLLMGPEGLAPAHTWLQHLEHSGRGFWDLPSLFWFWEPGDGSLRFWALLGTVGSLALVHPRVCPVLSPVLAFLYLSFANIGGTFFSFQWDNLIVESLLLGAGLGPEPGKGVLFLWRLLFLKLSIESGLAKVLFSSDWTEFRAMGAYWPTVPLPTPLTAYALYLPEGLNQLLTLGTLIVEMVLPLLIFVGPRSRGVMFVVWVCLQLGIMSTGNYGIFNLLSCVVGFSLLAESRRSLGRVEVVIGGFLALCSLMVGLSTFVYRRADPPSWVTFFAEPAQSWRVANAFHLFAAIDPKRYEVDLMGYQAGEWHVFPLRYKPPAAPRFIAPYHPRVDFRLWFFTLGQRNRPPGLVVQAPDFVRRLLYLWCNDPVRLEPLVGAPVQAPEWVGLHFWKAELGPTGYAATDMGYHPNIFHCSTEMSLEFPQSSWLEPSPPGP